MWTHSPRLLSKRPRQVVERQSGHKADVQWSVVAGPLVGRKEGRTQVPVDFNSCQNWASVSISSPLHWSFYPLHNACEIYCLTAVAQVFDFRRLSIVLRPQDGLLRRKMNVRSFSGNTLQHRNHKGLNKPQGKWWSQDGLQSPPNCKGWSNSTTG